MGGGVRRRGAHRSRKSRDGSAAEVSHADSTANLAEVPSAPPSSEKPSKRGSARSSQGIKPDREEVILCIESLYVDELKPFGRILRKRVAERYMEQQHPGSLLPDLPDVDIKHLKAMCDESECLLITPEEGGDWSATFRDRPERFVDVYSPDDNYSEATWTAAREYFEVLPELDAKLPGGRYSCAQALVLRKLPFLAGFSLGKVCHMVQLAISQHKILGYCNGAVVPYRHSQSKVKEDSAMFQQPCLSGKADDAAAGSGAQSLPLATLEKARECLRDILDSAAPAEEGPSSVPLSNVKRLFRSKYSVELSETSLGHSKLSELLQDKRFSDVCEVQLQGQGYIVVQVEKTQALNNTISIADNLPPFQGFAFDSPLTPVPDERVAESFMGEPRRLEFCPDEPLNLEEAGLLPDGLRSGEPSPLLPLPTPLGSPGTATPNTASRWPAYAPWFSASMPKETYGFEGMQSFQHAQATGTAWDWPQPPSLPLGGATQQLIEGAVYDSNESTADSARSGAACSIGSAMSAAPRSPVSSSGHQLEPQSPSPHDPPMKVNVLRGFDSQVEPSLLQHLNASAPDLGEEEPRARIPFCPGEPLSLEDAGIFERSPPGLGIDEQMADSGVKNTFIHQATTPLVTPQPESLRRSQSVPKDVGFGCAGLDGLEEVLPILGEDSVPSAVATPAFLPPPTPSSPIFSKGYNYEATGLGLSADPALSSLNRVIRLADFI